MSQPDRPMEVTGGCLCGAVRYILHFTKDSPWPPGVTLLARSKKNRGIRDINDLKSPTTANAPNVENGPAP